LNYLNEKKRLAFLDILENFKLKKKYLVEDFFRLGKYN